MTGHPLRLAPLVRYAVLQATAAIVQGLVLAVLVPVLRALLRPQPDLAAAGPWLLLGAAGVVVHWGLAVLGTPAGFAASAELTARLRLRLMSHVTTLPLGWFTDARKGTFVRSVTGVTGALGRIAVAVGGPVVSGILTPATLVVVTFVVDWRIASMLLVTMLVALPVLQVCRRVTATVVDDMEVAGNEVAARAVEFGHAQAVLRAAGSARTGTGPMRDALADHHRRYRAGLDRLLVPDLSYTAVVATGFVVVLVATARHLLDGSVPVADATAVLVLAARFLEPLGALAGQISGLGAGDYAVGRLRRVLRTPALPRHPDPVRALPGHGIEFEDVRFRYGRTVALAGVTFTCAPGSTTALVGPSGSGKTTVTRLVARFFDPDGGRVRIGGVDVREIDETVLMSELAIVFQDVYLFDTSIEDNLRVARPDATAAELAAAARSARLDEVVDRLPDGWRTAVGEGGARLSGGERQRVSIARAFLAPARIVLIDEAASALDAENEQAIGDAVAALAADPARTVIVIAHRPATLEAADHVVALDAGRVVEEGAPDALLRTGGAFARIHHQFERSRRWRITRRPDAG